MHNKWCLATKMEACFEGVSLSSLFRCFGKYFLALVRLMMERLKDKCRTLFSSRGCLGCCTKPPLVISVDEPSKGLKIQGQRVKKRSLREDFWSISSGEMDNSAFPSQRSISSISTSNQTLDTHSNAGSTSNPSEFVNHGFLLWNQTRNQWIGNKGSEKRVQTLEPKLCWNATYESVLGTGKPFGQAIPLAEMVDFLVDVWE
ncbi:Hypothetical predicted protein [Olea europaea subsp. europaea]|uniref:Gag1-like clamp domain-containing protein n=1 Tax=Olea europaea subsp. europaea TaxID=158383 RepID=A0A8S0SCG3_OLEEU|nr:Hypothetical predicted protein [Olea europaea subsp. europaea]